MHSNEQKNRQVVFKSKAFLNKFGPYVRPRQIAFFVNFGKLELSYRFQTLHIDSCGS